MTREFRIFNSKGDMIDLLNNLDFFSIDPSGLGVSFDNSYNEANSSYLMDSSKVAMGQFNIDIIFGAITGQSYERYDDLINLLNYPPYTLEYETSVGKWSRKCKLNELTKTEIKDLNVMIETITLDLTSPWYVEIVEQYTPTPEQDGDGKIYKLEEKGVPAVIFSQPPDKYNSGDRWNWDQSQVWDGMNWITRNGNLSSPLILNGKQQTGGNQKNEYFADGQVKITKQATGGIYYFAGYFGATAQQPESFMQKVRDRTVTAFIKKLRGNNAIAKPCVYLYWWVPNNAAVQTAYTAVVPGEEITKVSAYIPADAINILVGLRYEGIEKEGDWLSMNDMGLQIENDIFQLNPATILKAPNGGLMAVRANEDLDLMDWTPTDNQIFTLPPTLGYKVGDIWKWDDTQTWDGMNMVSSFEYTQTLISNTGVETDSPLYRSSPLLKLGSTLYTMGNRSTPNSAYTVRINYYDSNMNFLVQAISPHNAGTAATDNTPRLQKIPENSVYVRFCIEAEPSTYFGASTVSTWSMNPKTMLQGATTGRFTPVKTNTKLDFNDMYEYTGPSEGDPTFVPFVAYNHTHYYDYIYGDGRDYSFLYNKYAYVYDYVYEGKSNGDDGVYLIDNDSRYLGSSKGSPIEITIYGPAKNPYWYVFDGSTIVQSDGFNLEIPADAKLVVSSLPSEQKAVMVTYDGKESNVYQQQRLDLTNFVTIPQGASQLVFYNCKEIDFIYRKESVVV
ncbi:MAG: phage baseplate protein [Anaerorhabdus sp.]|uniref:phage distal tail protein domain-containing protein n=1 Tax=Anaerorhabdus sp. TaxID=1872524 RepID=UPI002FCABCD3